MHVHSSICTYIYLYLHLCVGEKYDWEGEFTSENSRFEGKTDVDELPDIVRMKGGKGWKVEKEGEMDNEKIAEKAKKIKRNKLTYSGISF